MEFLLLGYRDKTKGYEHSMYTIVLNIFFSILRFFRAILLFISQTPFLATCRIWNKQSLVLKM